MLNIEPWIDFDFAGFYTIISSKIKIKEKKLQFYYNFQEKVLKLTLSLSQVY